MAYKTKLSSGSANFRDMMSNGFGIVTVMNAKIYDAFDVNEYKKLTAYGIIRTAEDLTPLCTLDTLKIANVTQEGPSKTITGGQYSNPLIKFGKSARLEMQDALGNSEAIESLCGGIQEFTDNEVITGLHFGEDFQGPKLIIGESFFIERKSGKQVPVKIVFYQFLPDSIFNLTQDAEGDATVFDMNGDLLTTNILVGKDGKEEQLHGVFYSIVDPNEVDEATPIYYTINVNEEGAKTFNVVDGSGYQINGANSVSIEKDTAMRIVVTDVEEKVVLDTIVKNY